MRRVEQLIASARDLSQNTRYDKNSGILQRTFVQYLKNAQSKLVSGIINSSSKYFLVEELIDVVNGQEKYDYPEDIYLMSIDTIEWSNDSMNRQRSFIPLTKNVTKERVGSVSTGYPFGYIIHSDGFILSPPIESGVLRVNYNKDILQPEKRSGLVSAVTLAGQNLSAITVDPTETSFDLDYINQYNFLCVSDADGNIKAKNVRYTSASVAGVFTLLPQTLEDGQTIAVGDYITVGKNTVNAPQVSRICEPFLIQYMIYSAKFGDASKWTAEAKNEMKDLLGTILESFAHLDADITEVPITNYDYLMM